MFFKRLKNKLSTLVIPALILLGLAYSCKPVEPDAHLGIMDPKLVRGQTKAAWWDTNTIYYFEDDTIPSDGDTLRYYKRHLRSGQGSDIIDTDSVWGRMYVDTIRHNITFDVWGYITKTGDTINQPLNSTTWHYEIQNDTSLFYESSTTLGRLSAYP